MKHSIFSENQIINAIKEDKLGKLVGNLFRELDIGENTFYYWCNKYESMK